MSLRRELVDAGLAHRDQREFGGDEEAVGEDQRKNREQAEDEVGRIEHLALLGPTLAEPTASKSCQPQAGARECDSGPRRGDC